jgi:DNA-binding PadR family transcriptional regulator
VVLAMLAKEPSHGYELRARLRDALGPLGDAMNAGQVYVTLTRLEKAGPGDRRRAVRRRRRPAGPQGVRADPDGQQRVAEWIAEVSWPKPDLARVPPQADRGRGGPAGRPAHHRRHPAPRAAAPAARRPARRHGRAGRLDAALLLEGIVLRLQADLRWLEACESGTGPDEGTSGEAA